MTASLLRQPYIIHWYIQWISHCIFKKWFGVEGGQIFCRIFFPEKPNTSEYSQVLVVTWSKHNSVLLSPQKNQNQYLFNVGLLGVAGLLLTISSNRSHLLLLLNLHHWFIFIIMVMIISNYIFRYLWSCHLWRQGSHLKKSHCSHVNQHQSLLDP